MINTLTKKQFKTLIDEVIYCADQNIENTERAMSNIEFKRNLSVILSPLRNFDEYFRKYKIEYFDSIIICCNIPYYHYNYVVYNSHYEASGSLIFNYSLDDGDYNHIL